MLQIRGIFTCNKLRTKSIDVLYNSNCSAIKSSDSQPAMRRRMSDGATRKYRSDRDPYHGIHSRALTLDSDVARSTSSHPLASPSSASSVKNFVSNLFSAHNTRPRMKRVLSDVERSLAGTHGLPSADQNHSHMAATKTQPREERRLVIVHDVRYPEHFFP